MYSVKKNSNKQLSDREYYKIHSQKHSAKHIKAMKDLQRLKVSRDDAHKFVKKYIGK